MPKSEKWLHRELTKRGYETFLPLCKSIRQWSDRRKKIVTPLFPNYIFVKIKEHEIFKIRSFSRIVSIVSFKGIPSTLKDKEIRDIQRIESNYDQLSISPKLKKGEKVKLLDGPLKDLEGIIQTDTNKSPKLIVNLPSIQYSLSVTLTSGSYSRIE